jgi:Raf kinase inhibitor-like YbhB/YbcL family protein
MIAAVPVSTLAQNPATAPAKTVKRAKASLKVTSTAFTANQAIPADYTCDGAQVPPPLAWSAVPKATRSIAVLVEDPDAPGGSFTHWLITGLPPTMTSLPTGGALPEGAVAAKNGKGEPGYVGPCPPSGRHHYHFHVYALENTVPAPASKDDFLSASDGHVLAEGDLVATYQKVAEPKTTPAK